MSKISLIPYLEPGDGKFYLDIISPYPPADSEEQSRYPFQILNDSEPFSRLLKARLVSGGGVSASQLFLLVQRDSYRHKPDEIFSLSNPDLDRYWQQTFSYISSKNNLQNRFFPLKDTSSPEGRLFPFHSLLFCTYKKRFFHPPCPTCGNLLELCEDDHLLSSKGLMVYSSTLMRYLLCPSCQQDGTDVYTYVKKNTDPLIVKDFHELVRSWRDIAEGRIESRNFPCASCFEQAACYGETGLCNTRIIPFNFYPSYIFAFQANSMSAMDFLPLVSGAAIEEIVPPLKEKRQYGRLNSLLEWQQTHGSGDLFLYDGKAEQFLEILYLKLSFLSDISRIILTPETAPIPLDTLSAINCLWVDLPHHNSLLPGLWNFKINLFTVGSCETDANTLPTSHPSQTCYCLGIIWFFALLRNKRQSVDIIKEALKQILKQPAGSNLASDLPISAPENIFWDPDAHKLVNIPGKWRVIWTQAISLGEHLFKGNYPEIAGNDGSNFFSDIERLREEIKQLLFYKEKEAAAAISESIADKDTGAAFPGPIIDVEIHRILSSILKRWQAAEKPPAPPIQSKEETLTQTVILSKNSGIGLSESAGAATEKAGSSGSADEEIQETVILKVNAAAQKTPETMRNTPPPEETEAPLETVILKKNTAPPKLSETIQDKRPYREANAADENNDMPETLILKPSYTKDKHKKN